jgi:hypothetical protein
MASPTFEVRIRLRPDIPRARGGGFRTNSFDHLLQKQVELAGLDHRYIHTLIDAAVADDGDSVELTIHSQPRAPKDLTVAFRVINGTPAAAVRAVTPDGEVLAEAHLPAPLQAGQRVQIGQNEYSVVRTNWPGRDPATGVCTGDLDWQHCEVHPVAPRSAMPIATPKVIDPRRPEGQARRAIGR